MTIMMIMIVIGSIPCREPMYWQEFRLQGQPARRLETYVTVAVGVPVVELNSRVYWIACSDHPAIVREGVVAEVQFGYLLVQWDGQDGALMHSWFDLTHHGSRYAAIRYGTDGITLSRLAFPAMAEGR